VGGEVYGSGDSAGVASNESVGVGVGLGVGVEENGSSLVAVVSKMILPSEISKVLRLV
jgi:hypothetical protein